METQLKREHAVNLLLPSLTLKEIDSVAVVTFDIKEEKVNTLNSKLIPQFEEVLSYIKKSKTVKSVVLISGKDDCFIAGADINELKNAKNQEEILQLSKSGQKLFAELEALPQPVVAAINGACLGGGCELALACDFRVATTSSKTSLGLPEVMLGLLPGAGGTQRLPKLIGLEKALKMLLTGVPSKAEKAKRLGLVDHLVHPQGLLHSAMEIAKGLADGTIKRPKKKKGKSPTELLEGSKMGRKIILKKAREETLKKTRGLYPAPEAILDVLAFTNENDGKGGYEKEAELFSKLSQTKECKGLISLYFAQNETKKNQYGKPKDKINHIAVLGAGLMGSGISLVSAQKGFKVRLKDLNQDQIAKGKKYVWNVLDKKVKRKSLSAFEAQQTMAKVIGQTDCKNFSHVELVIEAVFEDLKLKHKVISEVEAASSDKMIFASNTSAIPIKEIAKGSKRPERVVGMHYFSPVEKMPLLEIIKTEQTLDEVTAHAVDVGLRQGKTVIVVNDGPGFYTTRILAPFMDEATHLVMEGVDLYKLESYLKDYGYPVGPITLMDEVGLDVALHVGNFMEKSFGKRIASADPRLLNQLVSADAMGRKSGRGFFLYDEKKDHSPLSYLMNLGKEKLPGRPINPQVSEFIEQHKSSLGAVEKEDVQKRMTFRMINEAALCLEENILLRPLDGDIGAVFGLGFPPFTGGPFQYVDSYGVSKFVNQMAKYEEKYGERFKCAQLLVDMAKSDKKFYP